MVADRAFLKWGEKRELRESPGDVDQLFNPAPLGLNTNERNQ